MATLGSLGNVYYGTTTNVGTIRIAPNQYNQSYTFTRDVAAIAIKMAPGKPREKTNLDWLDERVNEMRVRL